MKLIGLAGLVICTMLSSGAVAQEDTTPPVLISLTIVPSVFDAGVGAVVLTACATAVDDLSGLQGIEVSSFPEDLGQVRPNFGIAVVVSVPREGWEAP